MESEGAVKLFVSVAVASAAGSALVSWCTSSEDSVQRLEDACSPPDTVTATTPAAAAAAVPPPPRQERSAATSPLQPPLAIAVEGDTGEWVFADSPRGRKVSTASSGGISSLPPSPNHAAAFTQGRVASPLAQTDSVASRTPLRHLLYDPPWQAAPWQPWWLVDDIFTHVTAFLTTAELLETCGASAAWLASVVQHLSAQEHKTSRVLAVQKRGLSKEERGARRRAGVTADSFQALLRATGDRQAASSSRKEAEQSARRSSLNALSDERMVKAVCVWLFCFLSLSLSSLTSPACFRWSTLHTFFSSPFSQSFAWRRQPAGFARFCPFSQHGRMQAKGSTDPWTLAAVYAQSTMPIPIFNPPPPLPLRSQ